MSAHEMLRSSGAHSLWGRIKAQPDLFFGVILISILLVLLVPLPPGLVDTLLIFNFGNHFNLIRLRTHNLP